MECKKCKNKIENDWNVCPYCKEQLKDNLKINKNKINKQFLAEIITYIVVLLGIIFIPNTSDFFSKIIYIIVLIVICNSIIKYPKSIFIKILFIIFLIFIVLFLKEIILSLLSCNN